jgi:hypothetical protein
VSYWGHESVVKVLLETGRVDLDDTWSKTALLCAFNKGHVSIVKILGSEEDAARCKEEQSNRMALQAKAIREQNLAHRPASYVDNSIDASSAAVMDI